MLSLMTDGMFEAVEAQLTKMWKAKLVKLPKTSRIPHLTDPPPSFLAHEYYSTVQAIVAQARQADTFAALPAADSDGVSAVSQQEGRSGAAQVHRPGATHATAEVGLHLASQTRQVC